MAQATLRLGLLGSPLAVAMKVSVPDGRSSIFTVVNVDVIVTVILELRVNGLLAAVVNEPETAVRVYVPAMVNWRLLKVATPLTAATVVVPVTFAGDELTVMDADDLFARLPFASSKATNTEGIGVVLPPSAPLPIGCDVLVCPCAVVVKTSVAAAPALTAMALEVPVMVEVTVSVALIVWFPAVFSVAEKVLVPLVSVEFAGSTALLSVLVKPTVPM